MTIRATLFLALLGCGCQAFAPTATRLQSTTQQCKAENSLQKIHHLHQNHHQARHIKHCTPTTLYNGVIIDVDDNFFTIAFFSIGLFYSLGKAYNRYLLEEVAFEQRKLEARERRLEEDPTLDELDLRRMESAQWLSVYGRKFRGRGETTGDTDTEGDVSRNRKSRVATLNRQDNDYDIDDDEDDEYSMTDSEINTFEKQFGVEYDPYYDEPYEESELPVGKYKEDKSYGDRRYENGEVFYKDEGSGVFYRQGSRPRQKKFWDLNSS